MKMESSGKKDLLIRIVLYSVVALLALIILYNKIRPPAPKSSAIIPGVELVENNGGVILPISFEYLIDDISNPELVKLRTRENLEAVVEGSATGVEKAIKLCDWTNSQWRSGVPNPYPPWNANVILESIRSGKTSGFCAQYAVVFAQACMSLGIKAR